MKKLSNYTIARYCSDITDVTAGIDEIKQDIQMRVNNGKQVPYYYYVRLAKLKDKFRK